jgi:predicted transcriptional regulator
VLLSVHPRWAQRILTAEKTVEVRRRPPPADGAPLLLYATAPQSELVAYARIGSTQSGTPGELWCRVGARTAMNEHEFLAYLDGAPAPGALELTDVTPLMPRPLGFRAPQSWMWLRAAKPAHRSLLDGLPAARSRPRRLRGSR